MPYSLRGVLQSGGASSGDVLPLADATVTLYEARERSSVPHGWDKTDSSGAFVIESPVSTCDSTFYLVAERMSDSIVLLSILGPTLPGQVIVNELTTVAAVYCGSQFLRGSELRGEAQRLALVAGMNANVVNVQDGTASLVLATSPNADETNALRLTHSLANLFASWVRQGDNLEYRPANLVAALHMIAKNPSTAVAEIYAQTKQSSAYRPALQDPPPDTWTLAVKVNDSGSLAEGEVFGGPANIVFDRNDRAWITNNVVQGQAGSTPWSIILNGDGHPNESSPFTGGGLLGPGFGIDIDPRTGNVWIGNFGWGQVNPATNASVSVFNSRVEPMVPSGGFPYADRVQQVLIDDAGNAWCASYGNNRVVVYLGRNAENAIYFERKDTFVPFGIAMAHDGTAWVTNSYSDGSSICRFQIANGTVELLQEIPVGKVNKGIAIDSARNIWVASGGDSKVYVFDEQGSLIAEVPGPHGGIEGPWGLSLDGDGHVWVANFGPLQPGSFTGRLTQLAGSGHRPEGMNLGDPISPDTGYTLPSAGEQVLLSTGEPLYGDLPIACHIPLMRATSATVDRAGNVWVCNNWKPDFGVDREGNPGGDGIVIFVGLATPR